LKSDRLDPESRRLFPINLVGGFLPLFGELEQPGMAICATVNVDQRVCPGGRDGRNEAQAMTSFEQQVTTLTELERDALGEIANIAMGRAAASIRTMVGHQVLLSVPAAEILSKEAAAQIVGAPDNRILVAVRQDFNGAFSGRALLIFPETSSFELMRAVIGRSLSLKEITESQDELLAEIGNVVLNSWVATIANLLKRTLPTSLPMVVRGDGKRVLEGEESATAFALFLRVRFEINHFHMRGHVALLMDTPSIVELRSLVAEFVISITQTRDEKNRGRTR
jgi:chemotaxis protein CheC